MLINLLQIYVQWETGPGGEDEECLEAGSGEQPLEGQPGQQLQPQEGQQGQQVQPQEGQQGQV